MKVLTSVCGVIVALAIVGTTTGQEGDKRTIKQMTRFMIDAKTKGIVKGTGIKQIEILEGAVAKKVLLDVKDTSGKEMNGFNREFVVKSVKMILADDTVVEGQILLTEETGKATLLNMRGSGDLVSDKGTRTWMAFLAEYDVAADSSPANIAQAKKDMAELQGTWRVVDMPSQFGPPPDKERLKKLKVVMKGHKMAYSDSSLGQENRYEGTINIDPKTKAFDWTGQLARGIDVFTRMGIYELKGDDLKIFFGSDQERAKNLDGKPLWVLVLKRDKSE